jgi:hypothetical protein
LTGPFNASSTTLNLDCVLASLVYATIKLEANEERKSLNRFDFISAPINFAPTATVLGKVNSIAIRSSPCNQGLDRLIPYPAKQTASTYPICSTQIRFAATRSGLGRHEVSFALVF